MSRDSLFFIITLSSVPTLSLIGKKKKHPNKVQLLNIDLVCNGMTCRHILMAFNFAQHKNYTIDNAHYEIKHV